MQLDLNDLKTACFSLAKCCLWKRGPVDVGSLEKLAKHFEDTAGDHAKYLQDQNRDPNIVTRAIRYIEHHHGLPRGDIGPWLDDVLSTLIEFVCPNAATTTESECFYRDIEEGIREARTEWK